MPHRLIYLHGFASGPGSKKAQVFRERFEARGTHLDIPALDEGDFEHLTVSGQLRVIERTARGEPVSLIGSSMGGYLAALYAARHPEVDRLVLMAPAFGFPNRLVEGVGPAQAARWKATGSLPLFHYGTGTERSVGWQLIEDGRQYEEFPEITQPALILHGTHDATVPYRLSQEFVKRRTGVRLELFDSDHELLNVVDRIWGAAWAFLMENPA